MSETNPPPGTGQTVAADHRLSLERIAAAHGVIDAPFRDTPQLEAASLGERLGCRLLLKVETLTPIRSFKARGAQLLAARLTDRPHLVCATAGNFGQGMAYAARKHGLPITIFVGTGASALKIERMRALGADVRKAGTDSDETLEAARDFAARSDARLVEDGRDAAIAEGAGTIGIELLRWPQPLDAVVLPLGDGALLGGVARWIKAHSPATRMIGVCASGSPAMARSWLSGKVISVRAATIADGIAVSTPHAESLADLAGMIDDVVLVDDGMLVTTMRLVHRELGLVVEPSGAAGLAGIVTRAQDFRDRLVATVLTGGNLTDEQMRAWLFP
jgi:threonine dehydratase